MKTWQKSVLVILCLLGMGLSAIFSIVKNPDIIGDKVKAPVHINIEIDKAYRHSISIIARLNNGNTLFNPTGGTSDEINYVVLHNEIINHARRIPYIYALYLRVPKETAQETLNAIEGISIFIGNKLFYFSRSDIAALSVSDISDKHGIEHNVLYKLPGLEYKESKTMSLFSRSSFINWYGDLNLVINSVAVLITRPNKFLLSWLFFIILIILCRKEINKIYLYLLENKKNIPEILLLGFIVLTGFLLRINGYVRYSSWGDELYSVSIASNPANPFISAFLDTGNPPFYFILLRFWFMIFGWTEHSGRLLSVVLGSIAIITLYFIIRKFANRKAAFLAAIYMALNAYFIDYSQEIRSYSLIALLVPIIAYRFFIIIQDNKMKINNILLYIILSIILVNTHIYGCFFILSSFIFFIFYKYKTKTFTWKNTVLFFAGNVIIALSLLPYIIICLSHYNNPAVFSRATELDFSFKCLAGGVIIFGFMYFFLLRNIITKKFPVKNKNFLEYIIIVTGLIYLFAFVISLHTDILRDRYFMIFYPFLIAGVAMIIVNTFNNASKLISGLCICFAFIWVIGGYEGKTVNKDVYHEGLAYISNDAESHPHKVSMEIIPQNPGGLYTQRAAGFYGYNTLPVYNTGDKCDVIYFNPIHNIQDMYSDVEKLGISKDKIQLIYVNSSKCVFKIYADSYAIE